MKALKACAALLVAGALLVGCGREWEEEVRFKVTRIHPEKELTPGHTSPPHVVLELDQEDPGGIRPLATAGADIDRFPPGVAVGDVVVCRVRQSEDNSFDGVDPQTEVGPCRAA